MHTRTLRLQLKRYLRGMIVIALTAVVVGIAVMYGPGPNLSHAQTATAPTPPAACVGGKITIPANADSSYQLAAVQDLMASRSQDECNFSNYVNWAENQLNTMAAEIAALQAALKVTPPAPCNPPNLTNPVTGVCQPPGTTPPPTTGLLGWLGADALTGTLAIGSTVTTNSNAGPIRSVAGTINAAGQNSAICGGTSQPSCPILGTSGKIVAGPTTNGIIWWEVQF
jgi:hypothetical protein